MGIMTPEELDRLEGVSIADLADLPPLRLEAECLDCGIWTPDDKVESTDDGEECCPRCCSTRLRWVEED